MDRLHPLVGIYVKIRGFQHVIYTGISAAAQFEGNISFYPEVRATTNRMYTQKNRHVRTAKKELSVGDGSLASPCGNTSYT